MRGVLKIAGMAVALLSAPARAQEITLYQAPCGPATDLLEYLATELGRTPAGIVQLGDGSQFIVFMGSDTGWTALHLVGDGTACVLTAGRDWTAFAVPQGDPT